ncbi:MAG: 4Fe-4S binding protein, partial [Deltaproteobacteria bacterium]|nr:4Fe-4S binding protein [Deltaproteobacteria bacterium]
MENKAYLVANPMTPCKCVIIDPELCTACHQCVDVCRTDVLVPNPEEGKPPVVLYPD